VACEDLKKYLTTPPTLVAPKPHKNLQLYKLATSNVVSLAIVIERGSHTLNIGHNIMSTSSAKCRATPRLSIFRS
jgi:hypothetical protein